MSYCEYHEFRAIDRPLTREQKKQAEALSSRAYVTTRRAAYTYHYSSFRGDPYAMVADCFDAMLFMASYGTRQLMFRFPLGSIDEAQLQSYVLEEALTISKTDTHLILQFFMDDEDGGGWIEGDDWLDGLAPLRKELLDGDYRSLYLFWLQFAHLLPEWASAEDKDEYEDEDEYEYFKKARTEPPVPPGLQKLSQAQETMIQFFEADRSLVWGAATRSPAMRTPEDEGLDQHVGLLSEEEKRDFLQRLSREEPGLSMVLNHRLRELSGTTKALPQAENPRTIYEIEREAEKIQQRKDEKKRRAKEKKRKAYLSGLSARVDKLWQEVDELVETKIASRYDKAVSLLVDLHDLAALEDEPDAFQQRFEALLKKYPTRTALFRRLRNAELLPS